MSQLNLVCLSLTPNLRCVGFTLGQSEALIIPPAIEVMISLFFICLYSGPGRWEQVLLVADVILYFIWALLDMLSHVVPAARTLSSVFEALDFLVGAVSFTPILVYSIYLYRLSSRDFIPIFPHKFQRYVKIALPISLVIAVAINEVSSFVGTRLGTFSNQRPAVGFSRNSASLWLSMSQSSLAAYAIIQFIFFLLAFSRLSRAFLDQRWIELTHSDERHYFHGIAWITVAIIVGVIETISGFAQVGFGVALARRILRLSARAVLMYGLLKGLDVVENFETLPGELRGVPRIGKRISHMFGVNPQRMSMFHRIPQSRAKQAQVDQPSPAEKQPRDQRVTVHNGKGLAPFLQIRFSTLDFPPQAVLADAVQQRRGSPPGLTPGRTGDGARAQQRGENVLEERAKSAVVATSSQHIPPDWIRPPERIRSRQGSGVTVSDNLSIVRDLELRFPNLPPRVTGKCRGSILGKNYGEDPFPVVGVSRQSSLRQGNPGEEGGASGALSSSGSIKRKPAPPLLENIKYVSNQRNQASAWGGLTQNTANHLTVSPAVPNSPLEGSTVYHPDSALAGVPSTPSTPNTPNTPRSPRSPGTPGPRKTTARDLIERASSAMSDASIRSAEWFASANSSRLGRTPLSDRDIEMYRQGSMGPRSARPRSGMVETSLPSMNLPPKAGGSTDDAKIHSGPSQPRTSIGEIPMRTAYAHRA